MIFKFYLVFLSLLNFANSCKCYSPDNIRKYVGTHITCNDENFKGWMVLRLLPGTYFTCNVTCPKTDCVDGQGLELLFLGDPELNYYTTFGACYDIKNYEFFCKK